MILQEAVAACAHNTRVSALRSQLYFICSAAPVSVRSEPFLFEASWLLSTLTSSRFCLKRTVSARSVLCFWAHQPSLCALQLPLLFEANRFCSKRTVSYGCDLCCLSTCPTVGCTADWGPRPASWKHPVTPTSHRVANRSATQQILDGVLFTPPPVDYSPHTHINNLAKLPLP